MIKILNITNLNKDKIFEMFSKRMISNSEKYMPIVEEIINDILINGDQAVIKYTNKFDCTEITEANLRVLDKEINEAYNEVGTEIKKIIKASVQRVKNYHEKQKQNSWFDINEKGTMLGQITRALSAVGIYVPGGKATYPSSVIMTSVPAKVAGVEKVVMVTPPNKQGKINPLILVAAKEAGVDEIYKVGGAQSIAALAFGTKVIPKVDKIVGPGNIYVTLAKKSVYGMVDIDMIAGPSEILVLADHTAKPSYIAADLLSQAEHDEMAAAILVTTSPELANQVKEQLMEQIEVLPKKEIAKESIKNNSYIFIVETMADAIEMANLCAPEHLELCINDPLLYLGQIKNAGAIFVGNFSCEPLGDYVAGPSHVLPTSGTARFFSPLSVDHFIKKSSLIWFDEESLKKLSNDVIKFAECEGLNAHANSIKIRLEK